MKIKRYIYILVFIIAALNSIYFISGAYLKHKANQREIQLSTAPEHLKNLTKEQILEDYDYFWQVAENDYAFYNIEVKAKYPDLKYLKNSFRVRLEREQQIDFLIFYDYMNQISDEFGNVGHFSLMKADYYFNVRNNFINNNNSNVSYVYKSNEKNITDSKTLSAYKFLLGENQPPFIETLSQEQDNLTFKEIDDNTVYIKIKTFNTDFLTEQKAFFDFYKKYSNKDNLIIDIRGNSGGNGKNWRQNIVMPNISEPLVFTNISLIASGMENQAVINSIKDTFGTTPQPITTLSEQYSIAEDIKANFDYWYEATQTIYPIDGKKMFNGEIYLLTDEHVYSSAETFVIAAKQTGFATVVGCTTRGDGAATMDIVYRRLPNSGLIMSFRADYPINANGKSNVLNGSEPDIIVDKKDDALEVCLNFISTKT